MGRFARLARFAGWPVTFTLVTGCVSPTPDEALGTSESQIDTNPGLVVSQVYLGGGNASPAYSHDFIEIFNRSNASVSLSGLSVQYASSAQAFGLIGTLSGTLPAGSYYLVRAGAGTGTGPALPTPDVMGVTTNMSGTQGKVALVRRTTALGCGATSVGNICTPTQLDDIVDVVGWGTSTQPLFEGSGPATAPSNNASALVRKVGGCTDTNQNTSDFQLLPASARNTATPPAPCGANQPPQVTSTSPTNGAGNVGLDANLTIDFSEPVTASGSWFSLVCSGSGNVSAAVTGGPQGYTLNPSADLQPSESCTVTILASAVTDLEGTAMVADHVFGFNTLAPGTLTPIHTIQGASHLSPFNGNLVTTRGIVTAKASNGYYLQDPAPDADDRTSEAIFVFTSSAPPVSVGDDMQVSGSVAEFRPGCSGCAPSSSAYPNLTITELASLTSQLVLSSGNALPAPSVIGSGGRTPPSNVIEDDATGDVETLGVAFDPGSDGLDFYESLEAMRVQVNDAVAAGPTTTFSSGSKELPVLVDGGAAAGLRTARGGIIVQPTDFNPERVHLANDLVSGMPSANVGDTLPGAVVGVLGYTFANFKLFYTQALPSLASTGVTPEISTFAAPRPFDLDIATFNVENLDPSDGASKFAELAGILVSNLKSPDIVALEEVQDNTGATNDGVVDATTTLNQLVAAISAAGGPSYSFRSVNPVNGQDGGEPGGNIRVAFLYRTDRGLAFVDHPGASSTTANAVVGSGATTALQFSPGRIDPTNGAFDNSRKPLAGQFTFLGQTVFVIANHFNSKGGDHPLFGRLQPPVLNTEAQRLAQANVVKGFVQQLLTADANARIVVLGDLNDFEFSPPVTALEAGGLHSLIERLPPNERYSYVFQGNSQTLDQTMASDAVNSHVVGLDVVHVNAEFAVHASDHDPSVARFSFDYVQPVINAPVGGNIDATASGPTGAIVTYSLTANDDRDGALPVSCAPASGSLFPSGVTVVSCTATDSSGNVTPLTFTITVQAAGAAVPVLPAGWLAVFGLVLLTAGTRSARRRR